MRENKFAILLLTTTLLLTACGKSTSNIPSYDIDLGQNTTIQTLPNDVEPNTSITKTDTTVNNETITTDLTFEDLSKLDYSLYWGAGGWSSEFKIEKDGYFHGNYHAFAMDETSDEYPDGTIYICSFYGHFTDLVKLDEYTYSMKLADISCKNEPGTEEDADGMRFIYTNESGLANSENFKVYLPGKPINEISEEVCRWYHFEETNTDSTLNFFKLENVDQQEGIICSERKSPSEEAATMYNNSMESYNYWIEQSQKALTTYDMSVACGFRYDVADDCLNYLWNLIKYNTDGTTFHQILEDQRAWIKMRDEVCDQSNSEYAGGSMSSFDSIDAEATLTMERCKELLNYIQ